MPGTRNLSHECNSEGACPPCLGFARQADRRSRSHSRVRRRSNHYGPGHHPGRRLHRQRRGERTPRRRQGPAWAGCAASRAQRERPDRRCPARHGCARPGRRGRGDDPARRHAGQIQARRQCHRRGVARLPACGGRLRRRAAVETPCGRTPGRHAGARDPDLRRRRACPRPRRPAGLHGGVPRRGQLCRVARDDRGGVLRRRGAAGEERRAAGRGG